MRIGQLVSCIVLCLLWPTIVNAQFKTEVTGWVRDVKGIALPGANVVVYDVTHTIVTFQSSDLDGSYKVKFNTIVGQRLAASFVGYKTINISLDTLLAGRNHGNYSFTLVEDANLLGEVVVRQENVKQDTVKINLKELNLTDDSKLEEILKKSVGFQLAGEGVILYNGKSVERIMVNGKETFVHQNSLALQSIENRMIEAMSIVNNHKDKFSLDFDESEETVINIKTKQEFKNIVTGSALAGYGFRNKFDTQLKGFYFSENINVFTSSNNNNVGKGLVELRDLESIFNTQTNLSDFQLNSLSDIFNISNNRLKNFQSTSNITLRKENNKFRFSTILYSVDPNKLSSIFTKSSTLSGQPLLDTSELTRVKTISFFSAVDLDYRLSSNKVIKFQSRTDKIYDIGSLEARNEVFINNTTSALLSKYLGNIVSSQNDLLFDVKLSKKLLYNTAFLIYNEHTQLVNSVLNSELYTNLYKQNIQFDNKTLVLNNALKYNISRHILPVIGLTLGNSKQIILDDSIDQGFIRKSYDATLSTSVTGRILSDKFMYNGQFKATRYLIGNRYGTFLPFTISGSYENRLNRFDFFVDSKRTMHPLSSAITTTRFYNRIIEGSKELALANSFSNSIKIGYSYTNLFQGKAWSCNFRSENYRDILGQSFINISDKGISTFSLFTISRAHEVEGIFHGSKNIFKYIYPIKIDGEMSYLANNFPTIISNEKINVKTNQGEIKLSLETISRHALNFEVSSNNSFSITHTPSNILRTYFLNNVFSARYTKLIFAAKISFIYDTSLLLEQHYQRQSINCEASIKFKKTTLGLDGRNVGDIIGLFNNTAYNTRFQTNDGVSSSYIMDRALNYIITSLKYTF